MVAALKSFSSAAVRGSSHAFLVCLFACQIAFASVFHRCRMSSPV